MPYFSFWGFALFWPFLESQSVCSQIYSIKVTETFVTRSWVSGECVTTFSKHFVQQIFSNVLCTCRERAQKAIKISQEIRPVWALSRPVRDPCEKICPIFFFSKCWNTFPKPCIVSGYNFSAFHPVVLPTDPPHVQKTQKTEKNGLFRYPI